MLQVLDGKAHALRVTSEHFSDDSVPKNSFSDPVIHASPAHIAPTIVASACPSGPLTSECYRTLKDELLRRLKAQLPVDRVLMPLHGAAAADGTGDLEGDLLAAVRELVGPSVPIVATLDLHAHVTKRMVQNADALLAWETYPHRDAFSTGQRGARALLDILDGKLVPSMVMAKVPVLVSGVYGQTEGDGPFADVMRAAKSLERRPEIYSTSAFLVHPYLDLPDMQGGALVIANNQRPLAEQLAIELAQMYWARRFDLEPKVYEPLLPATTIRTLNRTSKNCHLQSRSLCPRSC